MPGGGKPLFQLGNVESFLLGAGVILLINLVLIAQGSPIVGLVAQGLWIGHRGAHGSDLLVTILASSHQRPELLGCD